MNRIESIINQYDKDLKASDLVKEERGKFVIKHAQIADGMIKMIYLAPIHRLIKQILIMRIASPFKSQDKQTMSHMAIALQLGMKEEEVKELEAEGIAIVSDYMERICLQEATDAFNKERKLENEVRSTLEDSKPKGIENDAT